MNLKNNTLSLKTIVGLIIILIFLTLLSYRDFLITIKLMLFHFYDFPMLPLDPYYKIILLFDGFEVTRGDRHVEDGWYWQYLRFLPLLINWITFKLIPCFQMAAIPEQVSYEIYCSIWSISLVNYISGILTQISFFLLIKYKFQRPIGECVLILLTSYFIINFLDRYGVDRLSFLFLVIFFLLEKKTRIIYFLIVLSIFINEKCLLLICSYYFLRNIDPKHLIKSSFNKAFILSFALCLTYLYIIFFKFKDYMSMGIVDFNYLSFHALSNSIFPLILITVPFLIYFSKKNILKLFKLKRNFILIIILFFVLGIFVGGTGNMGRYLTYTMVIFLPLLNFLIFKILFNFDYFFLSPKYSKIEIIKMLTKH